MGKSGVKKKKKVDYDRGKIETIDLKKVLHLNRNEIKSARIEIDHINHGLNPKTKKLNEKRRSNFTAYDVEKFLMLLDGEEVSAIDYEGMITRFAIRVNCPVNGKFFGKEFLIIFELDYGKPEEIHTITLYERS